MASQERNEIDGSEGAIITFRMILECVSYERKSFVMISRCNGVRANNSCRELLVLAPVLRKLSSGTKVHRTKKLNPKKRLNLVQMHLLLICPKGTYRDKE
ncbi:MAG: hypothetical protein CL671_15020 [Balneola sp.]|nr:hypothetical protein [Balneola sp.]